MSDLSELYQELILDHNKSPRNFGRPVHANRQIEGFNPLCGDHYTVYLEIEGDRIKEIGFEGHGCAISKASASLMTTAVKGTTRAEAELLFQKFHSLITRDIHASSNSEVEELGALAALSGVAEFPARIKCAGLAWHALHGALMSDGTKAISTETTEIKETGEVG